ncbi:hypothetical protein WAK64_14330 [Bacillus spongiae]|uniref:Uncharacterized protein n=1 Tax=Bacillus spongiae TaxID=2683610 RepID=A0ABU8HGD9_9BACI
MNYEEKLVRLLREGGRQSNELLKIYEEAPDDENFVLIEMELSGRCLSYKDENCFDALKQLRETLEEKQIQILCNGAALNVYPSTMGLSMGVGRLAYKLTRGKQAKTEDLVDIFDFDEAFTFVSIYEQNHFYDEWLKSLG